jgi:uncharacterized repeat protein (TIGR04138 family)
MKKLHFQEAVEMMVEANPSFSPHSYYFMREALDFTIKMLDKPTSGKARHVSGSELLEGIRKFAIEEYGPLAKRVLNTWGIHACEDFGRIVFIMVENGVLGKTDQDRIEDFTGGYTFDEAFVRPFQPSKPRLEPSTKRTAPAADA